MDETHNGNATMKVKALYVSQQEVLNVINALLMVGSGFVARNAQQDAQKRLVIGLASLIEHAPIVEYPVMTSDERMCCPRCGNAIDYDEDEDEWLCPECDVFVSIWSEDVRCP